LLTLVPTFCRPDTFRTNRRCTLKRK
jgi:hypothetical protein